MKTLRTTLSPLSKAIAYCQRNVIHQRSDMHGYQDEGVDFIKNTPFCGLFVDLGLGKTVMAATAALDRIVDGTVNKVLIVGPKRVAKVGWPSEFEEWGISVSGRCRSSMAMQRNASAPYARTAISTL